MQARGGFDTDWWVAEDWNAFYQLVKPYSLIACFHGHTGTGVRQWEPEGEERPLDVINTGQTEKGFFVVEIAKDRMRLAYHVKRDPTALKHVEWEWRYMFQKEIQRAQPAKRPATGNRCSRSPRT